MSEVVDAPEQEEITRQDSPEFSFMKVVAIAITYLFHPVLLALYAFFFINACYPFIFAHLSKAEKLLVIIRLVINTIAFPLITIFIMQRLGFTRSLELRNRKERILPYVAMCLFYFWSFMVIRGLAISDLFSHIMLGAAISVFMAFFFNNFFKISIHAVGAGNFVAIALVLTRESNYDLVPVLFLVILLAGLIGSARLYLRAHRSRDIYTGYMAGILSQLIALMFF